MFIGSLLRCEVLTAEKESSRAIGPLDSTLPSTSGLNGITGSPCGHVRSHAQACNLFNRLVGGSILAKTDRVMGEYHHVAKSHKGGHAQCIAGILHEHQEGCSIGEEPAMQGHAVQDGCHAELTNTKAEVCTFSGSRIKVLHTLPLGEVGGREVCRSTNELGKELAEYVKSHLACLAACDLHLLCLPLLYYFVESFLPIGGQLAVEPSLQLGCLTRIGLLVGCKEFIPLVLKLAAAFCLVPSLVDFLGNEERLVILPTQLLAGKSDFVGSKRSAVAGLLSSLVG